MIDPSMMHIHQFPPIQRVRAHPGGLEGLSCTDLPLALELFLLLLRTGPSVPEKRDRWWSFS